MSNSENTVYAETIAERLYDLTENDLDFRNELAQKLLGNGEYYYLFCKEDAYHYFEDALMDVAEWLEEEWMNYGAPSQEQIREFLINHYDLEL